MAAFLAFLLQPMAGKALLPVLGGAASVWTLCLTFFQVTLLAGYAYTHYGIAIAGTVRQAPVHLLLLLAATLFLPVDPAPARYLADLSSPPEGRLLLGLVTGIGLPFLLLSSTTPLLQRWFVGMSGVRPEDAWVFYSYSNIGSLAALLSYPLLFEPLLPLESQVRAWSAGFLVFLGLVCLCMVALARRHQPEADVPHERDSAKGEVPRLRLLLWLGGSAIPASLLSGVTAHLTVDVASVPLLWVVPLALYLLSFVIVFARPSGGEGTGTTMPAAYALLLAVVTLGPSGPIGLRILVHLGAFFVMCLALHGKVAATRPAPNQLTLFYLVISIGGALGGMFNSLAAPWLFTTHAEYPLVLALSALFAAFVGGGSRGPASWGRWAGPVIAGVAIVLMWLKGVLGVDPSGLTLLQALGVTGLLVWSARHFQPLWGIAFAVWLGCILAPGGGEKEVLFRARSFYGTFRVVSADAGRYHLLEHGNIHHGGQLRDGKERYYPLFYYSRESPVGQVFRELRIGRRAKRVAVVGLGTGGLAAYGRPWQQFTFYEIDPLIVRIARDPALFTHLRDSPARCRVVTGDARLMLGMAADGAYDLLILDAYSSDAIPLHLITREAVSLYLRKLAPGGLLLFHVSNRYLDLEPVLGAISSTLGAQALAARYDPGDDEQLHYEKDARYVFSSKWVLLARHQTDFGGLARSRPWKRAVAGPPGAAWTDGWSSLLYAWRFE
ncbi:MAG TPA: fused MFS/spermidine synthase [Candidatus Ozemobacteraceae bacterium]|nr:fused MFS/spermidine synthase [Candidatus Ozemobacteraceae bacterium]